MSLFIFSTKYRTTLVVWSSLQFWTRNGINYQLRSHFFLVYFIIYFIYDADCYTWDLKIFNVLSVAPLIIIEGFDQSAQRILPLCPVISYNGAFGLQWNINWKLIYINVKGNSNCKMYLRLSHSFKMLSCPPDMNSLSWVLDQQTVDTHPMCEVNVAFTIDPSA